MKGVTPWAIRWAGKPAILNLIELKIFRTNPYLKPHILFYSNGLAFRHGFPDITHIKANNGHFSGHIPHWNLTFYFLIMV